MANKRKIQLRLNINRDFQNGMKKSEIATKYGISRRMVTHYTKSLEVSSPESFLLDIMFSNNVNRYSEESLSLLNKVRLVLSGKVTKKEAGELFTQKENLVLIRNRVFMSKTREIYNGEPSKYTNIDVIVSIRKKLKKKEVK